MSTTRVSSRGYPITAWSAVNGLGTTTEAVMDALHAGRSGLSNAPHGMPFETFCGAIEGDLPALPDPLGSLDLRNNRIAWCALSQIADAVDAARARWGAQRVGIAVGSSTTAMDETERAYGVFLRTGSLPKGFDVQAQASPEGLLRALCALTAAAGPATVVSTACSSSGKVFGTARRWLDAGVVDAVIVGGADSLCQITLRGFRALSLLSAERARPFAADRRGINIGEGAAFALIERRGEGPRLLGVGETADAHHMSSPDPEGRGALLAMQAALADAGREPSEVDYVNAHGTGTRLNDAMEALAIRTVLGPRSEAITVSTKGYTGHTLGAAGATEAVFVLDSLCRGRIPASLGSAPLDPDLGLRVATEAVEGPLRLALSNSFAFGGSNVCVAFGAPE